MVNSPLIRPYFLGVNVALGGSGPLNSYDLTCPKNFNNSMAKPDSFWRVVVARGYTGRQSISILGFVWAVVPWLVGGFLGPYEIYRLPHGSSAYIRAVTKKRAPGYLLHIGDNWITYILSSYIEIVINAL